MEIAEKIAFPGFEELIYVCDSSSLINVSRNRNLRELGEFVNSHEGRIRIPGPVGKEIGKKGDDLKSWWFRNHMRLLTKLYMEREHELHEKISINYAKEPFPKEGKTYTRLSDADTYAIVIAIARHWMLVTDDESMKAVCRQKEYGAKYMSTNQFKKVIKAE